MRPSTFYVIWMDDGKLFTLVDSAGDAVQLTRSEVKEDLDGIISSTQEAMAFRRVNDATKRYGVEEKDLERLFGVFL